MFDPLFITLVVNNSSMASVKVILRNKEKKDGTSSIALQIIKNRTSSLVHIGHSVEEKHWDAVKGKVKKSHPNSVRLNNLITTKLADANDMLLDLEKQKNDTSSKAIKKNIKSSGNASFFEQATIYIENLRTSGKYNRVVADEPRVKKFKEFLGGSDISFQEITVPLLNKFRAYLKGTRNVSERTIINYLILIRTVYNQAIKGNIIDSKHYPFGRDKIVIKFPDSVKIGLTPDEVKAMEDLELPAGSLINHSRNVFLFSFYFAGMRVSDVLRLKWSDFQNDRMYYSMGKNAKAGSLKVPEKALKIIAQYERTENDLVFPDLHILEDLSNPYEVQRKISYAVKKLDKYLQDVAKEAKIKKPLTMHIARHTFGNISGDKIPVQMLQKLYRHSSITTTIGYQANFVHKDADEALDAVIGF